MLRAAIGRAGKALAALVLTLALAACLSVRLVSDYDEQIDRGLTELYAETSSFIDRMIVLQGQPGGTYAANQQFYSDTTGRIDALIARAEGNQVLSNCPSARAMGRLLDAARLPEDVRLRIGQLPPGSCQVVVLRLLRAALAEDLRTFHRAQGDRGIPESARAIILDGGVGSLFRTAIMIEIAKRGNQGGGN